MQIPCYTMVSKRCLILGGIIMSEQCLNQPNIKPAWRGNHLPPEFAGSISPNCWCVWSVLSTISEHIVVSSWEADIKWNNSPAWFHFSTRNLGAPGSTFLASSAPKNYRFQPPQKHITRTYPHDLHDFSKKASKTRNKNTHILFNNDSRQLLR